MKQSRFTGTKIVAILQEAAVEGMAAREVCNRHAVCEYTFYRWHRRYGSMFSEREIA